MSLAKDPEVGLQFLVDLFELTISLGMVGSREGNVIFKELGEFLCKGKGKLWTAVQDYFVVETKAGEDMFEKQSSDTSSVDSFVTKDENHPLCKPMVDHDQNRVRTRTESELEESGRFMIISHEICWNGWKMEDEIGHTSGTVGWMLTLLAWQVAQPATNQ